MSKIQNLAAMSLAVSLFGAASCQRSANKNTAGGNAVSNTNQAVNTATLGPANTSTGTPTDAYKAAHAARKNKDVAALKKLMSKDIIEFMTMIGEADEKNKQTLDEMLMEMCETPQAATAEARNEKIDGDTAIIEYLDEKGGWQTMDFIKEEGRWKLTIAKADKGSPIDKKDKK